MATILITGNVKCLSISLIRELAKEYRVILAGKTSPLDRKYKNVWFYEVTPVQEKFQSLFKLYFCCAVIYVSGFLECGQEIYGEVDELEAALRISAGFDVDKFILLGSVESSFNKPWEWKMTDERDNEKLENDKKAVKERNLESMRVVRMSQLEVLCDFYSINTKLNTTVLHLPFLADEKNVSNYLGTIFTRMENGEKICFPYKEEQRLDFIMDIELAELLYYMIEDERTPERDYFICSGYQHTYGEFAGELLKLKPDSKFEYKNNISKTVWSDYPWNARRMYGWFPKTDVYKTLPELYENHQGKKKKREQNWWRQLIDYLKRLQGLLKYIELLLMFIGVEWLNHLMQVNVYFKFVDVRLFFIVIMGTVYGLQLGVWAAFLAAAALFYQYALSGIGWITIFYNVENWIPFVVYFMAGSVSGYVKDKKTNELEFAGSEYKLLKDKYLFLDELYQGALSVKSEYKKQILGYKDSFGKIFEATERLDHILADEIFKEALPIMEDILDNHTIAFYTVDKEARFGRLAAASNRIFKNLNKSIRLEEYPEMIKSLKQQDIWRNSDLWENYPMYGCGIMQDGALKIIVIIYETKSEQLSMYYVNLIKILCGLVERAFLSAANYQEYMWDTNYYPNTNIMRKQMFVKLVIAREEMQEKSIAEYILLKIITDNPLQRAEELSKIIRATDIVGEGDRGLYLLLSQVNEDDFEIVTKRLDKFGIQYERVMKL